MLSLSSEDDDEPLLPLVSSDDELLVSSEDELPLPSEEVPLSSEEEEEEEEEEELPSSSDEELLLLLPSLEDELDSEEELPSEELEDESLEDESEEVAAGAAPSSWGMMGPSSSSSSLPNRLRSTDATVGAAQRSSSSSTNVTTPLCRLGAGAGAMGLGLLSTSLGARTGSTRALRAFRAVPSGAADSMPSASRNSASSLAPLLADDRSSSSAR